MSQSQLGFSSTFLDIVSLKTFLFFIFASWDYYKHLEGIVSILYHTYIIDFGPMDLVENAFKSRFKPEKTLIRRNFNLIWRHLFSIAWPLSKIVDWQSNSLLTVENDTYGDGKEIEGSVTSSIGNDLQNED